MKHPTIYLAVSLLLAAAVLHAGQNTRPVPGAAKASIEGTVTRAGAGQPLLGARISLIKEGNGAADRNRVIVPVTTDRSGQFQIFGVEPGEYRIAAERDGFIRQEYGQRNPSVKGMVVSVVAGQRLAINFQMAPAAVISGRVLDEQGEPVAGAAVQAQMYQYLNGRRTLITMPQVSLPGDGVTPPVRVITNDRGEYRLFWLQPGEYYISVTARSQISPYATVDLSSPPVNKIITPGGVVAAVPSETYSPIYFPGTPDPESAAPVSATAAAEIGGIDFTWRPIRLATIHGRVVAPPIPQDPAAGRRTGGPLVMVQLTNVLGGTRVPVSGQAGSGADPSGSQTFEIRGVPPGAYYVNASARRNEATYFARARIDVGNSDANDINVDVRPCVDVPGRIVLESAPPQPLNLTGLFVEAAPTNQGLGLVSGGTRVAENGTFILKSIAPVEYRVSLSGLPAGAYLASANAGPVDVLTAAFPSEPEPLEVRIGFAVGRVAGAVMSPDGSSAAGSLVTLIPAEPRRERRDLYSTATADMDGRFAFNNIPAGDYQLFAWEQIPSGAYQSFEFIHRFEGRGQSVRIESGNTADVQLNLIPAVNN